MGRFLHLNLANTRCNVSVVYLAYSFLLGLVAGSLIGFDSSLSCASLMRAAPSCGMSIVGLFTVSLLPLLISALAVFTSQIWLLIPLAFMKSFCFSYVCIGIFCGFGSAGWLICLLMMLPEGLLMGGLWWYWQQCLNDCAYRSGLLAFLVSCGIIWFDFSVISPFLADIINI